MTYQTFDRSVESPLQIDNPDAVAWDFDADVVVVGMGGAGVCAAIEAREQGSSVIALDRFAGGGATRYSGGVVYAGGGTSIQHEAGVEDTAEDMAKYLALEVGDAASPDTIRRYAEGSRAELAWLMSHGVPFDPTFYKEKIVYPPEGFFLQYSGNEKTPSYAAVAKPAARGHRTVGQGFTGQVFYDRLREAANGLGVQTLEHTPATRLLVDPSGRVIGVEATQLAADAHNQHQALYKKIDPMAPFNTGTATRASRQSIQMFETKSRTVRIRAKGGVVLTTGGFAHNLNMLAEHVPLVAKNVSATMRMASLGDNGSGHRLGMSAGGEGKGLDRIYLGRVMAPPSSYLHGIMVNTAGNRFASEDAYNSILGGAILDQQGGVARLVLNGRDFRAAVKECLFSGWATFRYFGGAALLNVLFGGTKRASTIAGLARKCGIDPQTLERTVARYNETIGGEDEFGKLDANRVPIKDKAYYAINFSIPNTFSFSQFFTMGGLSVDEETGTVLRGDGSKVAGLYAAGRTAFGLCSNRYVSGLSLGDNVFSGRRAGRSAASEARAS